VTKVIGSNVVVVSLAAVIMMLILEEISTVK
jgi:hypothetical protein